ncbi:MAG: hypothetical protein LBO63_07240 [Oscillospiraceae bacterium]|jgi:pyruvate/2-oxoglutarate dehydrogenase complex dihydrolipoamide acyltransferase (E2) component|nr:hypothetical protein [Oscillospiraceae bacterium]
MSKITKTGYKRRHGDRTDGRYLRGLDPYHKMMAYIMPTRNDAQNLFTDTIQTDTVDAYLRKKRLEDDVKTASFLHFVTAAYVRTCSQFPEINRFIAGQRVYARYYPELVMSIKLKMEATAPETSIKVPFDVADTFAQVVEKMQTQVDAARSGATATDNIADTMMKLPRLLLKFAVWLLRTLDYFGKMPNIVLNASPFHGSVIITDLGSMGIPPVHHHIYNFGTLPIFVGLGAKRKTFEMQEDGSVVKKKVFDLLVVSDERITDGFYFAHAFKYLKYLFKNPELLDAPPEKIVEDVQ